MKRVVNLEAIQMNMGQLSVKNAEKVQLAPTYPIKGIPIFNPY